MRSQVQSEVVQVGLAMQHLGALLLKLGRTILMLRMGKSPVCAPNPKSLAHLMN